VLTVLKGSDEGGCDGSGLFVVWVLGPQIASILVHKVHDRLGSSLGYSH